MNTIALRRANFGDFDKLVRHAFYNGSAHAAQAAAEINRDGDDAVVRIDLPGVDVEKDVIVELDKGRLVIRGERRDERTEQNGRSEVRYGAFNRSFGLPAHVTAEAISAAYDAGVLTVRVAGVHAGTEPQKISISA